MSSHENLEARVVLLEERLSIVAGGLKTTMEELVKVQLRENEKLEKSNTRLRKQIAKITQD